MRPFFFLPGTRAGIWLSLMLLYILVISTKGQTVFPMYPNEVASNSLSVEFKIIGEPPEFVGYLVETNDPMLEWDKEQPIAMEKWRNEIKTNRLAKISQPPGR